MTVVRWSSRLSPCAHTLAALEVVRRTADPSCAVTVTKDVRTRRYLMRVGRLGYWRGEVWMDGQLHRHASAVGVADARRLATEFARELRALLVDGWTET